MDVREAIRVRRAYRSLDPVEITEELIRDLAESARLAPSCFNNQPWRFVFAHDPETLEELHGVLSRGNQWANHASMIVAVFSRVALDCVVGGREYHLFDTGMATAFLILRATELGLVAHPIAGFSEREAKRMLGIPEDMRLITLVMVGRHSDAIRPVLTEGQVESERTRPERMPLEKFAHINKFRG
ncbi:nitroreductase [miscellaneous Crenarchaeota group-15 archaeon DG-45]|uniref:Nitroreductase n=1 Tax=miscellaneous Crenarchaeota group-15 archaeon DG-45 TaxID=1685127 RepID=A0A0M0BRC9_9ARCH|nr:MAG: nitroreductase [miscellaneous Crenarchaeota group-15 archaeon DG-45]